MESEMVATEIKVCEVTGMENESVRRFDHDRRTFAIYSSPEGEFFATDGLCTHERSHPADGVMIENIIECSRHFGQLHYKTGEAMDSGFDGSPGRMLNVRVNTLQVACSARTQHPRLRRGSGPQRGCGDGRARLA
jgi:3-phenylpropionate/trans-cinnamate dioxygenase ferredoxin component